MVETTNITKKIQTYPPQGPGLFDRRESDDDVSMLFAYGILKTGFPLDLRDHGATFIAEAEMDDAALFKIHSGVGLRFIEGEIACGEVFDIPETLWHWLDKIENNGVVYKRVLKDVYLSDIMPQKVWVYEHVFFENDWYSEARKIKSGNFTLDPL